MGKEHLIPNQERGRGKRLALYLDESVVWVLRQKTLPQRMEGGCTIQTWNPYRNLKDSQLPWTRERLEVMMGVEKDVAGELLPANVSNSIINLFGQIIVGLREGKSLAIVVGEEPKAQK